jgi:uncharacterized coiled-coil protein SlyX
MSEDFDRLERRIRDLEARARSSEVQIEDLRTSTSRETGELRQAVSAVAKDIEDLTRTLRDWRGDMDQIFRDRWPTLEGRLARIETTIEGIAKHKGGPVDLSGIDWRVIGLIGALLFGGGLTVGGGGGAGISALMSSSHPSADR